MKYVTAKEATKLTPGTFADDAVKQQAKLARFIQQHEIALKALEHMASYGDMFAREALYDIKGSGAK